MAFGNVTNLPYIRNYEAALAHWERTPQPKAGKWEPYQRPLDTDPGGKRKWHYRIERHHDAAFEICLYHTVMARYEKPEGDTRVVCYAGDSRSTSTQFMWHVLGTGFLRKQVTTEGVEVAVPIGYCRQLATRLTFIGDRLDVSRSTHPVMCTWAMSDEDKAQRKEMREKLVTFIDAMELQMETFAQESHEERNWHKSPFVKIQGFLSSEPGDAGFATDLSRYAQAVYNSLLTRACRKGEATLDSTSEVFRRSLMNNVLKELGVNRKSKIVKLPLFLEWDKYPRSAVRL